MKYEGDLNELILFGPKKLKGMFCLKFQGEPFRLTSKYVYATKGAALVQLKNYIENNIRQAHHWHKGKNNSFSKLCYVGPGGKIICPFPQEMKKIAAEMTEELLKEKIFEIIPITNIN
jgi:hypothetical protein